MMDRIKSIFSILDKHIPIPAIELEYDDPYTLLVAVILSAQSTDRQVNKVTDKLFVKYNTPKDFIDLGVEGLMEEINSIGLYRNKAKNIINMSLMLVKDYNGAVPNSRTELMKLPGVGRKSADVMLNVVFRKPTIAVDTHVFRVSHRLGLTSKKTRDMAAEDLERSLPTHLDEHTMLKAHHLLVLHGRYVCTAKKPKCDLCPLSDLCESKDKKNK